MKLSKQEQEGLETLRAIKEGLVKNYPLTSITVTLTIRDKITGEKTVIDI